MRKYLRKKRKAQSVIEYLILLAVVTGLVLSQWHQFFQVTSQRAGGFFNKAVNGIYDDPPVLFARVTINNYP